MQSLLQPGGELEKDGGDDPGWLQNTKYKTENRKYKISKIEEEEKNTKYSQKYSVFIHYFYPLLTFLAKKYKLADL